VTLHSLWKATCATMNNEPSPAEKEALRDKLSLESESELLQRQFSFWDKITRSWHTESIQDVKEAAVQQAGKYLRVVKEGLVRGGSGGILDRRICCDEGADRLDGFVVMCIGDTRVLTWNAGTVSTLQSFRVV
jgi:hypothetical protein